MNYGNAGIGAASHLCGLLFMSALRTDVTTVPFNGTGPGDDGAPRRPDRFHVRSDDEHHRPDPGGGVKVYGVTSAKRVPSLPTFRRCRSRA